MRVTFSESNPSSTKKVLVVDDVGTKKEDEEQHCEESTTEK